MSEPFTIDDRVDPVEARDLLACASAESITLRGLSIERREALLAQAPHRRVARVAGQVVGLALADEGETGTRIRVLAVLPERRRLGIARALIGDLAATGSLAAMVESPDAAADAFFTALGWRAEEQGGLQMRRDLAELPSVPPTPNYRIRTYEPGDDSVWTGLIRRAFATEAGAGRHTPGGDDPFRHEFLDQPLWEPGRLFFAVREPDGEPAGTTASWEYQIEGRTVGLIHWVAVDPAHRGRRLGEALNLTALHDMRARGHREAYLHTNRGLRAAVALYERLGFVVSRRPLLYRAPSQASG
jgi:mycothiol synthase